MRVIDSRAPWLGAGRVEPATRRRVVGVCLAAALGVAVYLLLRGRPVMRSDEAWFSWVTERVGHGDTLYRDVYYVSTPLAAWLGAAVSLVGGTTVRTMRVVSVAIFVVSAVLVWWTARRARLGFVGGLILVAALFAYASPVAHFASVYSSLAILSSLVAFAAGMVWLDNSAGSPVVGLRPLSIAGVALGLSIASKPNTGFLTLGALVVTLLVRDGSQTRVALEHVRRVLLAAAIVVAAILLLIVATGGFSGFVGDVILEKNDYLRVMNRSLLSGYQSVLDILPGNGPQVVRILSSGRHVLVGSASLGGRYFETFPLVPLVGAVVLAWVAWRTRGIRDRRVVCCAAFFIAGWASAFPQPGAQHLTEVTPLLIATAGAAVGLARQRPRVRRPWTSARSSLAGVAALWLAFGVVTITARALENMPGGDIRASTLPHMQDTPVDAASERRIRSDMTNLRALTGGRVFIVRADAAFYYLAGSLRNPTPYDFAARSDFGRSGEEGVVDLFDQHRVRFACVTRDSRPVASDRPDFRPRAVIRAVRDRFRYVARLRACTLFQDPALSDSNAAVVHTRGE